MTFAEDEPVPVRIVEPALIDIEIMIVEHGQYVEAREVTSRMSCLGIEDDLDQTSSVAFSA